jgi:hypothetical protein
MFAEATRLITSDVMRLPLIVASLVCVSLTMSSASAPAQDLGRGRSQLIEGGGPVDVEQLVQRAGLIVHGSVVSREPRWIGRVIYTHYELLVQETLKGLARGTVVAAVVGGAIGNVQLTVPGAPELSIGDQLVFFGVPLGAGGVFTPVGMFDGVVPIRRPGANSVPTVSPRGAPETLATFLEEVRALSKQP